MLKPRIFPAVERLSRFALNRRGMISRTVPTRALDLHVYDGVGRGSLPTVVMLHGLGAAGGSFGRVVGALRPHVRRVLIPELPGHGASVHPGNGLRVTPELLLDAMVEALDQLLDEPAIVYGNSLGGAVALSYAVRRPARVRSLVLVSPAGAVLAHDEWSALRAAFDLRTARDARQFMERVYHRPPWFLALIAHEFPGVMLRPAVREILESTTPEHASKPAELAALTMPILLVWGRSEKLLPASSLAWFRQNLPAQTVIEEPEGFGHAPQLEEPARIAERILAFARAHR